MLAGCVLYAGAFRVLTSLKKSEQEEDDFLPVSWEDSIVYQISFGICAFSMAVSAGSVLLLPISSISNEILHHYPSSWWDTCNIWLHLFVFTWLQKTFFNRKTEKRLNLKNVDEDFFILIAISKYLKKAFCLWKSGHNPQQIFLISLLPSKGKQKIN